MSVGDSGFAPEVMSRKNGLYFLKGSMRVIREDEDIGFAAAEIMPVNLVSASQPSDEQIFEVNHFVEIIQ